MSSDPLIHRLPLRSGLDVEIKLPRDFTKAEAERIASWIEAIGGIQVDEEEEDSE